MEITTEQQQQLKKYLSQNLYYRETYEEIYDHMISALAHQETTVHFEDAVNRIICEDFGGYEELAELENKAKRTAVINGLKKYLNYFSSYFKWPVFLATLCGAIFVYFTIAQLRYTPWLLRDIFAIICICPRLLALQRYCQIAYFLKDTRRSIKDNIFSKIAYVPVAVYLLFILWPNHGLNIWRDINPLVLTALFVMAVIYILSLFKLYQDEFKMSIISRS